MESHSNDIIDRIINSISKLADEIRYDDQFGKKNILNVHGLVCLMRYAVWNDENAFKEWIFEQEFNKNKGILDRIFLHKDKKDGDGVEIRIHIFSDGNETFRHNHAQDFVTMCIHGEYEYSYYTIEESHEYSYERFERIKGGKLIEEGTHPGRIVKAKLIDGKLRPSPNAIDIKFSEGSLPIFVPCEFHHTVNHVNKEVPVITIVARRGKKGNHKTTVIQDLDQEHRDARKDQEQVVTNPSSEDKILIYEKIREALLRRGHSNIKYNTEKGKRKEDIRHYSTKFEKLARFEKNDADDIDKQKLIFRFLKSNNFTSTPIMNNGRYHSILRKSVLGDKYVIKEPISVNSDEHILGAVLWNVVSRDLVVPVVDKGNENELIGLFSISDLVDSDEEFDRALIYSIAKENREDNGEKIARNFLKRLKKLSDLAFDQNIHSTVEELDELSNELMSSLGPLIVISPNLDQGRFRNIAGLNTDSSCWLQKSASWPMYKLNIDSFDEKSIEESTLLLEMLSRGSDMSQILLSDQDNVKLLTLSEGVLDLEITNIDASISEVISRLSGTEIPIIVSNDSGEYGILTKDDLCGESAIKELCKHNTQVSIDSKLRTAITEHVLRVGTGSKSTLEI